MDCRPGILATIVLDCLEIRATGLKTRLCPLFDGLQYQEQEDHVSSSNESQCDAFLTNLDGLGSNHWKGISYHWGTNAIIPRIIHNYAAMQERHKAQQPSTCWVLMLQDVLRCWWPLGLMRHSFTQALNDLDIQVCILYLVHNMTIHHDITGGATDNLSKG